jgi:CDP-glucose 4,6-dehydratase
VEETRPEVVFHLAAQPLVRYSYREPIETFSTNVVGTLHALEASRRVGSVRAFVCVTSDKVYENQERGEGYVEEDRLGGSDPYSASKACTEILAESYRRSFLESATSEPDFLMATVRAGNVIGGGDWSEDRLIPDAVKAVISGKALGIRSPHSVRPWQHVLEPLSGYLLIAQHLLQENRKVSRAWNFGPDAEGMVQVCDVAEEFQKSWPALQTEMQIDSKAPKETKLLTLSSRLAQSSLGWKPLWNWREAVEKTALWYKSHAEDARIKTQDDIEDYWNAALVSNSVWVTA